MNGNSTQGPWWVKISKRNLHIWNLSSFLKSHKFRETLTNKFCKFCVLSLCTVLSSHGVHFLAVELTPILCLIQSCLHSQITCCCTLIRSKFLQNVFSSNSQFYFNYYYFCPMPLQLGVGTIINTVFYKWLFSELDNMLLYFIHVNFLNFVSLLHCCVSKATLISVYEIHFKPICSMND